MSDGVTLSYDKSSSEKVYKVKDNGIYIFRITGNNGRRIKIQCIVTNAIPIKKDLLTAVSDINTSGISKCKIIGKTSENAKDEEKIYSLDTIFYKGDLVLDGLSAVGDILPNAGKIYEFGYKRDVSDGTNYAQHTVVLKVEGNLTIQQDVTLTSVGGGFGGPKGMIVYCTGTLENNGDISMSNRGAYAEGENVYIYKNNDSTYEFIPAAGSRGGNGTISYHMSASQQISIGMKGEDGVGRGTAGGGGGSGLNYFDGGSSSVSGGNGGSGTSYSGGGGGGRGISSPKGTIRRRRWESEMDDGGTTYGYNVVPTEGVGVFSGGSGGLLICFSKILTGIGSFSCVGWNKPLDAAIAEGSSGGGSINVFYIDVEGSFKKIVNLEKIELKTNTVYSTYTFVTRGCNLLNNGGDGSATFGSIKSGYFIED